MLKHTVELQKQDIVEQYYLVNKLTRDINKLKTNLNELQISKQKLQDRLEDQSDEYAQVIYELSKSREALTASEKK